MSDTRTTLRLVKGSAPTAKKRIAIVGFGTIGKMVANLLAKKHIVQILDKDTTKALELEYECTHFDLELWDSRPGGHSTLADQLNAAAARNADKGTRFDLVINCSPHFFNVIIAKAAKEIGSSYIDLSEDVESGKKIELLAEGAKGWFIPRCGVAPGLVQIMAGHLAKSFETVDEVKMRVGALPKKASNAFGYALTWSTDGLINEYANPCEAVVNGTLVELPPLEGAETMVLDGVEYEAFNTSGGLGTLARSMDARSINYKTLRYPGHREKAKFMLFDMRMLEDRDTLKAVIEKAIPRTEDDHVVVYVSVSGAHAEIGRFGETSYLKTFENVTAMGQTWTAIQRVTGGCAACVAEMILDGDFEGPGGCVRQEDIDFAKFASKSHWKLIQ